MQIGYQAYKSEDWYHTLLWTERARVLWSHESNKTISKSVLLDYLAYAHAMVSGHWTTGPTANYWPYYTFLIGRCEPRQ